MRLTMFVPVVLFASMVIAADKNAYTLQLEFEGRHLEGLPLWRLPTKEIA